MNRSYKIKSKETIYGEFIFRSVLEARWAVFFDSLGIDYTYEPYCFEVETSGREVKYMPDFFLPNFELFIEIKPNKPVEIENIKAAAWSKYNGDTIILFNLNVPIESYENGWKFYCEDIDKTPKLSKGYNWCECPRCGKIDIAECGEPTICNCFSFEELKKISAEEEENGIFVSPTFIKTTRLIAAYKVAKNHLFCGKGSEKVPRLLTQINLFK